METSPPKALNGSDLSGPSPSKVRIKKFNPFSKQVQTEDVIRTDSITIPPMQTSSSVIISKESITNLSESTIIKDLKQIPTEISRSDLSSGNADSKKEDEKVQAVNKEVAKLRREYQDTINLQKITCEKLKRNIDEIAGETTKPNPDSEKVADLQQRVRRQLAEMKPKDLKKEKYKMDAIKKTKEFLIYYNEVKV